MAIERQDFWRKYYPKPLNVEHLIGFAVPQAEPKRIIQINPIDLVSGSLKLTMAAVTWAGKAKNDRGLCGDYATAVVALDKGKIDLIVEAGDGLSTLPGDTIARRADADFAKSKIEQILNDRILFQLYCALIGFSDSIEDKLLSVTDGYLCAANDARNFERCMRHIDHHPEYLFNAILGLFVSLARIENGQMSVDTLATASNADHRILTPAGEMNILDANAPVDKEIIRNQGRMTRDLYHDKIMRVYAAYSNPSSKSGYTDDKWLELFHKLSTSFYSNQNGPFIYVTDGVIHVTRAMDRESVSNLNPVRDLANLVLAGRDISQNPIIMRISENKPGDDGMLIAYNFSHV